MSCRVKDKISLESEIPNKCQIPLLNHRDDGELRAVKMDKETCKIFSFKTLRELQITHNFIDCEVAIAEDFFWTAQPFIIDGEFDGHDEDGHDAFHECVVGSVWGTPCVITPDGDAYACYEKIPYDEFPGVYLKDWDIDFLDNEIERSNEVVRKFLKDFLLSL